jgi:hypothetical protein
MIWRGAHWLWIWAMRGEVGGASHSSGWRGRSLQVPLHKCEFVRTGKLYG